jgi:hypothetical protein
VYTWNGYEGGTPPEIEPLSEQGPDTGTPGVSTFVPDDSAVELALMVTVRFTLDGKVHTLTSAPTVDTVINVNDPPVAPTMNGTPAVGQTLSVGVPQDGDGIEDVVFTYTWERASAADAPDDQWVAVKGPGSDPLLFAGYAVVEADAGMHLRVVITYTDNLGQPERAVTVPVAIPAV